MVEVIVPEHITVHLGRPNDPAENVTVPFIDYIKNVACSEVYPTWPEAALRANIYAQTTFALNRVFTEWYRSQGRDFDITNSTQCDQAFQYGRDIFGVVSRIVDDLYDDYIRRVGTYGPIFSQYCNGTTTTCDGLSQWGTVNLAEQGKVPYQILQYYYGEDIEIVRNAPVADLPESYPGRPLEIGDYGRNVSRTQIQLNRISVNYPRIPKLEVDGRYGRQTAEAVRIFQEIFNLEPTGQVDRNTWYQLIRIYISVKKISELSSEGIRLEDVSKQYPKPLQLGSRGESVRVLQYFLSYVAAFNEFIPNVTVDGIFGEKTRESVLAFQRNHNLEATGIVDEKTWNEIYADYRSIIANIPIEVAFPLTQTYPGFELKQGMRGDSVKAIQEYLNYIALFFKNVPTVAPSGYFGPSTTTAVRRFQNEFGLKTDGIVNEETFNEITTVYTDLRMQQLRGSEQAPTYVLKQ